MSPFHPVPRSTRRLPLRFRTALQQQGEALYSADAISISSRYRRTLGRVSAWKRESGYGFISHAGDGTSSYVHIKDVLNAENDFVTVGTPVEFDPVTTERGSKAVAVVVLR